MPKPHTFQTLFNEMKTVTISFLSKYGYLKPNRWQSGTITWSSNGNKTGSISIRVNTEAKAPCLELDYKCNETRINYRVQLFSAPSNLGKGVVWFFVCPSTGKRCRKLYLADNYFVSRFAFVNAMYEQQTKSHKARSLHNTFDKLFGVEELHEKIYSKHFKSHYAGKPTKRYLRLLEQIRQAEQITLSEVHTLFS